MECWRGVCKGVGSLLEGEGGTLSMGFYNIQLAFRVVPISRMLTDAYIKGKVTKPRSQGMVGSEGYRSFTSAEPLSMELAVFDVEIECCTPVVEKKNKKKSSSYVVTFTSYCPLKVAIILEIDVS